MEEHINEVFKNSTKDNSIILEENNKYFILIVENEKEKNIAIKIIKNGDVYNEGVSFELTKKQYNNLKKLNYTIINI